MKVFTIDWGSYSAKIFHSNLDKKKITHEFIDEIVFDHRSHENQIAKWDAQLSQIQSYCSSNIDINQKVILSTPSELLSFRFKNLPVTQSKKSTCHASLSD